MIKTNKEIDIKELEKEPLKKGEYFFKKDGKWYIHKTKYKKVKMKCIDYRELILDGKNE